MSATPHPSAKAASARARRSLKLALQTGSRIRQLPATREQLRRWILPALERDADLTLRFVGRNEALWLNRNYRQKAYAPDVLTFVYPPSDEDKGTTVASASGRIQARACRVPRLRADIVLCVPVLSDQARAARIPLAHRLAHLVIHATLHAQGYEHERDGEAKVMQAIETSLLRRFRIPDPWD